MTILESCEIEGDLVAAMGDGTDPVGSPFPLIAPPAWVASNLGILWTPGNVRGADVDMPNSGSRPFRRLPVATTHSLPFVVSGDYDWLEQDPCPADRWVALERNLLYISEQLIDFPGTREGTRDSILTMPSGAQRFASPHYLKLSPQRVEAAVWLGTLDISIPDHGWFRLPQESPSP